jgi:hypothetical protein
MDSTKNDIKRQRVASESMTSLSRTATANDESDEDAVSASKSKKARADAVHTARQAEQRERNGEREKARAEAAGRRQERAGRRRVDGEHAPPSKSVDLPDVEQKIKKRHPNPQTAHAHLLRPPPSLPVHPPSRHPTVSHTGRVVQARRRKSWVTTNTPKPANSPANPTPLPRRTTANVSSWADIRVVVTSNSRTGTATRAIARVRTVLACMTPRLR